MTTRHWQASYGKVPAEINPDAHASVTQLMDEAMQRFADRPAFRGAGQTLSYGDMDRCRATSPPICRTSSGVKKGDRIAVMTPNLLAFPIAFLGIIRAGAAQVNVNPLYTPRELEHQLNDAGVETIVVFSGVSATVAEVTGQDEAEDGHHQRRRRRQRQAAAQPAGGRAPGRQRQPGRRAGRRRKLPFTPVALNGDDLLFLQYTGGTTGLSKGAALSHRNLVANVEQYKAFMPAELTAPGQVIVTAIPLYHVFALMVNFITFFSIGADNWLVPNPRDFDAFIDTMKAARPNIFMGVNTLYAGLVAHPRGKEIDWSRLKLAGGGGAAVIERGVRQVEGDDRHHHPRGLRPVGDQPGGQLQPAVDAPSSAPRPGCRCRRPTSSCSTTTARKWAWARPARSSSRARR